MILKRTSFISGRRGNGLFEIQLLRPLATKEKNMNRLFLSQFACFPKFALFLGIVCFCLLIGIRARALEESVSQNCCQWRAPEANGVCQTARPPLEWSQGQNFRRKVKITDLFCCGIDGGKIIWQCNADNPIPSPVTAARRVADRSGKTWKQSKRLKLLAANKLEDSVNDSPDLAGSQLFLRSRRFLCALADSPAERGDGNGQKPLVASLLADWNKDSLSRAESQTAIDLLWADCRQRIAAERAAEIKAQSIQIGGKTLRYLEKTFGRAPEGERSLWISMHGGGGAPPEVNDSQWKNQIQLYQPAEGFYVAPRAPTDTWNLWHQPHIDGLFDRLIENYVAARGVNPNRVYLTGYSAGGDGVYQLATRMADRWAAASMMAGHPNDVQPDNLRNIGFGLFVGGKDGAYKRNQVAAKWKNLLFNLRQNDPNGYPHLVRIYPEMGHWMNRKDAEALPWMSQFRRNPWPKKIVWRQAKGITSRFYWLQIPKQHLAKGQRLSAEVDGQTIRIAAENAPQFIVRLSDLLVNLDHPITIIVNGKEQFRGKVNRSAWEIVHSLQHMRRH